MKRVLLTTLFVLIGSLAFTQERIAVFPFEDMDNIFTNDELSLFYGVFLNEFVNKSEGKFKVIVRQQIDLLFGTEENFQFSDFTLNAYSALMGQVLSGSKILYVTISKIEENLSISISFFTYPETMRLFVIDFFETDKTTFLLNMRKIVQSVISTLDVVLNE